LINCFIIPNKWENVNRKTKKQGNEKSKNSAKKSAKTVDCPPGMKEH
jgi:hypothetical protein